MKIALSGSSGFVANALKQTFSDITPILRDDSILDIQKKLENIDVVINLAGAPIINRWSESYKKILLSSRIETTRKLVKAIDKSNVKHFISTSAIGIYPDNMPCNESCIKYGEDFLASLAKAWEKEALKCTKPTAILRFGIVLGADGGALKQMLTPFKLGVGGVIGDGSMKMSWIDIQDLVSMYQFIIQNNIEGIFNATAPHPVTNTEFTKELGKVLQKPTIFPLPEFVLKIIFGEAATVLTGSKEIYPNEIIEKGFQFSYPTIESSLKHLLQK